MGGTSVKSFDRELKEIRHLYKRGHKLQLDKVQVLNSKKPLILYGAGTIGHSVARVLRQYRINVSCFCDKNKAGMQEEGGLPIISPRQMIQQYPNANIVICSMNYQNEIMQDLTRFGIDAGHIFLRDTLALSEMTYDDMIPYLKGYGRAFELLQDDKSKQIFLERIRCYLTSIPITYSRPEEQYFDPEIINMEENEIFVDGGMYVGDTASVFFRVVHDQYRHYYGFEPDQKNFQIANKSLQKKSAVSLIQAGLWSENLELAFNSGMESGSKLDTNGCGNQVEVTALDIFFANKNAPTFIKLDIEGAELEALKGAENIIRNFKPKLAVCVYHKPEDLYTIPELIKSYRQDYRLYLRHYSDTIYETVLYAV